MEKLYEKRNFEDQQLFDLYMKHLRAMTRESLYSKADIAAELAYRDQQIELLTIRLDAAHAVID